MRKIIYILLVLAPILVLAQVLAPIAAPIVIDPNQDFMEMLIKSFGGVKGMTTLGIVGLASQLLMKFMATSWFNSIIPISKSSWKLPMISLLTIVGGVIGLMMGEHMTLLAALVHSTTLSAVMVFSHQWLQWLNPEAASKP